MRQVMQFAKLRGWRVVHFRPGRTLRSWRTAYEGDGVGFPDLVLLRANRGIVIELKVDDNLCSDEQKHWLEAFFAAGFEAFVWRPCLWEEIEKALW
jgi:hypothetical protein